MLVTTLWSWGSIAVYALFTFTECILKGVNNINASDLAIATSECKVTRKILYECEQGMIAVSDPLKCVTSQCFI